MSRQPGACDFTQWADAMLAGTGWTAASVRDAAARCRSDLATAALADGFAAAARGLADTGQCEDGAA